MKLQCQFSLCTVLKHKELTPVSHLSLLSLSFNLEGKAGRNHGLLPFLSSKWHTQVELAEWMLQCSGTSSYFRLKHLIHDWSVWFKSQALCTTDSSRCWCSCGSQWMVTWILWFPAAVSETRLEFEILGFQLVQPLLLSSLEEWASR